MAKIKLKRIPRVFGSDFQRYVSDDGDVFAQVHNDADWMYQKVTFGKRGGILLHAERYAPDDVEVEKHPILDRHRPDQDSN